MVFFTLLLIPILIVLIFVLLFGRNLFTWQEAGLVFLAGALIAGIFTGIDAFNSKQWDNEYVNGKVVRKEREKVSCSHDYECNCYNSCSGSGKDRSCTRVCSTCYEHSYDVDWAVYFNIPERITIDRVNRQGTTMPDRWEEVAVGDSGTLIRKYTNYVKGAPESLFYYQDRAALAKYPKLPSYPMKVYDYYKATKVWDYDGAIGEVRRHWNTMVARINSDLGPKYQMNLQLVVVKNKDPEYFQALRTYWLGGKKNDIIVVFSVDDKQNILWVDIMAWAQSYAFNVSLRDSLQSLKKLDEKIFPVIIQEIQTNFRRKPMREFQYLKNMATPSPAFFFWALLVETVICTFLALYFTMNDVTYENENNIFGG